MTDATTPSTDRPAACPGTSEARDAIQTGLDRAVETGLLAMAVGRFAGGAASRVTPAARHGSLVQPGSGPRNSTTSSACAGSEPWH